MAPFAAAHRRNRQGDSMTVMIGDTDENPFASEIYAAEPARPGPVALECPKLVPSPFVGFSSCAICRLATRKLVGCLGLD